MEYYDPVFQGFWRPGLKDIHFKCVQLLKPVLMGYEVKKQNALDMGTECWGVWVTESPCNFMHFVLLKYPAMELVYTCCVRNYNSLFVFNSLITWLPTFTWSSERRGRTWRGPRPPSPPGTPAGTLALQDHQGTPERKHRWRLVEVWLSDWLPPKLN